MLKDELELVKSLTSTLASFKEDPNMAAGIAGRQKTPAGGIRGGREDMAPHSRDPDVWPPPTPQEQRSGEMGKILTKIDQ